MLTLIFITENVDNIVYPWKICYVNINNKYDAAQINLIPLTTNISKVQIIPGTVFLVVANFFLLEYWQNKTLSLLQETPS